MFYVYYVLMVTPSSATTKKDIVGKYAFAYRGKQETLNCTNHIERRLDLPLDGSSIPKHIKVIYLLYPTTLITL